MSIDIATLSKVHDLLVKTGNSTDAAGLTTLFAQLAQIRSFVDQVEPLIGLNSDASGTTTLFARMAQIAAYVDTVETTIGTVNTTVNTNGTNITAVKAKTDLIGAAADAAGNTTLFAQLNRIYGAVDQVEGFTDTIESVLGTNGDAANTNASMWAMLKSLYFNTATPASPIKSVQRGTVAITTGTPSFNITVSAVNMAKTFLNLNILAGTSSSGVFVADARLTSATNILFTVAQNSYGSWTLPWELVEYN